MSTSNRTDYGLVTNTIIDKAYRRLGKATEGAAITARMYEDGLSSLNLMVKAWGTSDRLWLRTGTTKALVASTASYALTPRPQRILDVRRRNASNVDIMMTEWSRAEYLEMPSKTSSGAPVNWYYDPQLSTGTLYVWPVPTAADATAFTLYYTYTRRIEDFIASNNDPDLPQEWLEALTWGLANNLETQYPVNDPRIAAKIERNAAMALAAIESWDTETASVFVRPSANYRYRNHGWR